MKEHAYDLPVEEDILRTLQSALRIKENTINLTTLKGITSGHQQNTIMKAKTQVTE